MTRFLKINKLLVFFLMGLMSIATMRTEAATILDSTMEEGQSESKDLDLIDLEDLKLLEYETGTLEAQKKSKDFSATEVPLNSELYDSDNAVFEELYLLGNHNMHDLYFFEEDLENVYDDDVEGMLKDNFDSLTEDDLDELKRDTRYSDTIILQDLYYLGSDDDLQELRKDTSDFTVKKVPVKKISLKTSKDFIDGGADPWLFDSKVDEMDLLLIAKLLGTKISNEEWNEIASTKLQETYIVQKGDNLWNISKKLFGTGFYYSKIWAMNPNITNPHVLTTAGMELILNTGDADTAPSIMVGNFSKIGMTSGEGKAQGVRLNFNNYGDFQPPKWLRERQKLMSNGAFFQFDSDITYEDLVTVSQKDMIKEYDKYQPTRTKVILPEPGIEYDKDGFDRTSKYKFNYSEGFHLNTFITSNIVVDLGKIAGSPKENVFLRLYNKIYVDFDRDIKVRVGDMFSVYSSEGKVSYEKCDREGYRYTIVGHIKVVRQVRNVWECIITNVSGIIEVGARITAYMEKNHKIIQTFSRRNVEAIIIGSYLERQEGLTYGDVVYLDRGRADGLELGNVMKVYSSKDGQSGNDITVGPTYQIGEVTVITLTDNFATGLITYSSKKMSKGSLAFTKRAEEALQAQRVKDGYLFDDLYKVDNKGLDELDVELNLDDTSDNLLDSVDNIQLTDDEIEELERQEREKSVIKEHERDLRELEKLESDILGAQATLDERKLDEDKLLEQEDLDAVEKKTKIVEKNSIESVDDIEEEVGKKYLEQDLNIKENPYGLTEFDLEEVDQLLNTNSSN